MILVTGGTGLVGARLLYDLTLEGKKVRALRRKNSTDTLLDLVFSEKPSLKESIEWFEGDVTDVNDVLESMQNVDEVFHCAAKVSFHSSEYKEIMKVNVQGTANMVNMAMEAGVKKFCHVSSIAALGRVEENKVMNEQVMWKSSKHNSMYAVSKYSGEREVWRGMEEGLNAVIVSPAIIVGPGDWKSGSSAMFKQVYDGMKYYSLGVNGFVGVKDVTLYMRKLMEKNLFGQRYIISAENRTYQEIFNMIADSFQKSRPTIKVNGTLSELGWRAEALRSFFMRRIPFITRETARNSQLKWFYTSEKIINAVGNFFTPLRESIEESSALYLKSLEIHSEKKL
jgi:dihydroflavonol-4-reductase